MYPRFLVGFVNFQEQTLKNWDRHKKNPGIIEITHSLDYELNIDVSISATRRVCRRRIVAPLKCCSS